MSRTIDELLREALLHFDVASNYGRAGESDAQMALDAMDLTRVRATVAEDLPDAVAAIVRELN